jgi:hypothetical protein
MLHVVLLLSSPTTTYDSVLSFTTFSVLTSFLGRMVGCGTGMVRYALIGACLRHAWQCWDPDFVGLSSFICRNFLYTLQLEIPHLTVIYTLQLYLSRENPMSISLFV